MFTKAIGLYSAGLILCAISAFDEWESRQTIGQHWPCVVGRITQKEMMGNCPQIVYSYSVGNKQFTGNTVRIGFLQHRSCLDGDYAKFSNGQSVRVWYESSAPAHSYLIPAYDDRARFWYYIGGALIVLALILPRGEQ